MGNSRRSQDASVQSVDRAISILQALARRGPAAASEIADELGVHKSTVFRLLATLDARGLVEQNTSRGRYQLGYGVVQLAAGATKKLDLSVISRPICQDLAETVGETVNIAINDGGMVLTIDQVIGSSAVTTVNWVGRRSPLHATSAGKVFLASMPQSELDTTLSGDCERYTEHTIVDPTVLRQQLTDVRRLGYGVTLEEYETGLVGVAAPIRALDGQVIAALTVSGPTFRMNEGTIPGVAEQVMSAAAAISERNGYPKLG